MKLFYHPVSTTCRPIMLFAAESGIKLDLELVDLFTGAHFKPEFLAVNPSAQVPVLEDGDFRLTESSAILKYLADKVNSPAYPADPKKRARVNERMDWFNTGFYRDYSYGYIYPQIFPFMKREDERVQAGTVAYGCAKAQGWLKVLDQSILGPSNRYVCGNDITIASTVVLDNKGEGHTGYASSKCVHEKVDNFLLYGSLPPNGSSCAPEEGD